MENESVDTVVSMNGFHAFPDKQKAFLKYGVFWNQAAISLPVFISGENRNGQTGW